MLDDLKSLQSGINVAVDLLERLQPVVTAWRGETDPALQSPLEGPPGDRRRSA
jgi:hypothetical protein